MEGERYTNEAQAGQYLTDQFNFLHLIIGTLWLIIDFIRLIRPCSVMCVWLRLKPMMQMEKEHGDRKSPRQRRDERERVGGEKEKCE